MTKPINIVCTNCHHETTKGEFSHLSIEHPTQKQKLVYRCPQCNFTHITHTPYFPEEPHNDQ